MADVDMPKKFKAEFDVLESINIILSVRFFSSVF